jgi:hypothetical protein
VTADVASLGYGKAVREARAGLYQRIELHRRSNSFRSASPTIAARDYASFRLCQTTRHDVP